MGEVIYLEEYRKRRKSLAIRVIRYSYLDVFRLVVSRIIHGGKHGNRRKEDLLQGGGEGRP